MFWTIQQLKFWESVQKERKWKDKGMLLYKVKRINVNKISIYRKNDGKFAFTKCIEL